MRLLISLLLFLTACQPPPVKISQTTEVEFILDETGDIVVTKTARERNIVWAEVLIRGTHVDRPADGFLDAVPFVDSLYSKWFKRKLKLTTGAYIDSVSPGGMNFRQHQASEDSIFRAFDIPIKSISDNLLEARLDILNTAIADSLLNDALDDTLETAYWPWGQMEVSDFIPFLVKDFNDATLDSIRSDSVAWGIDPLFLRDSLIVCGEPLRTLRWIEVDNCLELTDKQRQWAINNIIQPLATHLGITLGQASQITVWETIRDYRRQVNNLIYRSKPFRKFLKRWLKRKLS